MMSRWSKAEVAMARRIADGQEKKFWEEACSSEIQPSAPLTKQDFDAFKEMILNAPAVPADPPWWQQAVAWADRGVLWIRGIGWIDEQDWQLMLKEKP